MGLKPDHWIRKMAHEHRMIEPFEEKQVRNGVVSYGVSSYGYDVRVADEFKIFTNVFSATVDPKNFDTKSMVDYIGDVCTIPPNSFALARTVEYFRIPRKVHVCSLWDHRQCHAVRAGVGGLRHIGNLEHHSLTSKDLCQ